MSNHLIHTLTGDVTGTGAAGGSAALTIASGAVTNTKSANMAANTVKANNTNSSAAPSDVALSSSNLLGRGSTGNIAPITVARNLTISGTEIIGQDDVRTETNNSFNLAATDSVIVWDGTGNGTCTLASAATMANRVVSIYNRDSAFNLTLSGTIGGISNFVIPPGLSVTFSSDGSNLFFIGLPCRMLLQTQSASSSSAITLTNFIDNGFKTYKIEIESVNPITDNTNLLMRLSNDGGSSYISSAGAYEWNDYGFSSAAAGVAGSTSDTSIRLTTGAGNVSTERGVIDITLYNMLNSGHYTKGIFISSYDGTDGTLRTRLGGLERIAAETNNAVQFLFSSGNIQAGTFRLYGVY